MLLFSLVSSPIIAWQFSFRLLKACFSEELGQDDLQSVEHRLHVYVVVDFRLHGWQIAVLQHQKKFHEMISVRSVHGRAGRLEDFVEEMQVNSGRARVQHIAEVLPGVVYAAGMRRLFVSLRCGNPKCSKQAAELRSSVLVVDVFF